MSGLAVEGFWLVVGLLFVAAAVWEYANPSLPLISVVLILAGVGVLRSVIRSDR